MEEWKNPKNLILWLLAIIFIFLILLFFIVVLINITFKKSEEKKEFIFNQKLSHEKELKNTIINVQDQERKQIASELHDQVSNKLNLTLLLLNSIETDEITKINNIKYEIKKIIDRNRDISHYLFPIEIENIGLIYTLQDQILRYNTNDFQIDLFCSHNFKIDVKEIEISLYRVIQEFLTNVLKHSKATNLSIHLRKINNKIVMLLTDNGIGYNTNNFKKGLGLTSIETRLNGINANFKFKSAHLRGTRLIVIV